MSSSKVWIFGLALIAVYLTPTQAQSYTIQKVDFKDNSCRKLFAYMVRLDKSMLNLSGFFPFLDEFQKKYPLDKSKREAEKGAFSSALRYLTDDTMSSALDFGGKLLDISLPCLPLVMKFARFWVHDVLGVVLLDQIKTFLH